MLYSLAGYLHGQWNGLNSGFLCATALYPATDGDMFQLVHSVTLQAVCILLEWYVPYLDAGAPVFASDFMLGVSQVQQTLNRR